MLDSLPLEILWAILSLFDDRSIRNCRLLSRSLNNACSNSSFWRHMLQNEFGLVLETLPFVDQQRLQQEPLLHMKAFAFFIKAPEERIPLRPLYQSAFDWYGFKRKEENSSDSPLLHLRRIVSPINHRDNSSFLSGALVGASNEYFKVYDQVTYFRQRAGVRRRARMPMSTLYFKRWNRSCSVACRFSHPTPATPRRAHS
jgi:hypothetical protein